MVAVFGVLIVAVLVFAMWRSTVELTRMSQRSTGGRAGSIDQDLVEARLGRIEEAIDAMALQIERLTDQQRTLLGGAPEALQEQVDQIRTERPR